MLLSVCPVRLGIWHELFGSCSLQPSIAEVEPASDFLTALGLIIGNASVILVVTISLVSKDFILDQIRNRIQSGLRQLRCGWASSAQASADLREAFGSPSHPNVLGNEIVAATG